MIYTKNDITLDRFKNDDIINIPSSELENYLNSLSDHLIEHLFKFLYTSDEDNFVDKMMSIFVEEYKTPEFVGSGDLIYGKLW